MRILVRQLDTVTVKAVYDGWGARMKGMEVMNGMDIMNDMRGMKGIHPGGTFMGWRCGSTCGMGWRAWR